MAERNTNQRNDITRSFQRVFNFPLDRSTIFDSYQDAEDYAKGDGSDSRKLGKTVYLGQIISVVNNDESTVKVYKVTFGTGGQVPPYSLEQIAEGSSVGPGEAATTEEAFSFRTKNGSVIIPAGSNLTEVVSLLRQISDLKSDGITTAAINNTNGETIVANGTDLTTALRTVTTYMEQHGSAGNISSDIEYDGETIIESGATLMEALQTIVNQIFASGGVNEITINGEQVYDPSTNSAKFNIEAADNDINVEYDLIEDTPTFYIELSGITNGTINLEGTEVDYDIKIYDYSDETTLIGVQHEVTFVNGTKVAKVGLPVGNQYYNQDRTLMSPDANGKYSFTVTTNTTEFIIFSNPI